MQRVQSQLNYEADIIGLCTINHMQDPILKMLTYGKQHAQTLVLRSVQSSNPSSLTVIVCLSWAVPAELDPAAPYPH